MTEVEKLAGYKPRATEEFTLLATMPCLSVRHQIASHLADILRPPSSAIGIQRRFTSLRRSV